MNVSIYMSAKIIKITFPNKKNDENYTFPMDFSLKNKTFPRYFENHYLYTSIAESKLYFKNNGMNDITSNKGEIVMYQPDETIRLEVRMSEEPRCVD